MSELFDMTPGLPHGCWHLKGFLAEDEQIACVDLSRELLATHPLCTPKTAKGYDLSLKVSSWGKAGWFGDGGIYFYTPKHPVTKQPWPKIPEQINSLILMALIATVDHELLENGTIPKPFHLETVLLNWYSKTGKLCRHQDVTERDHTQPIVTISLGDSCIFNIGSTDYRDNGTNIRLDSGDVVVMGFESRLAYHGVKEILPGTSELLKNGGRISLTGRQINP